jgi:hypothetical protein
MTMLDGLKKVMEGKNNVGFSIIYQNGSREDCVSGKF